MNYKVFCLLLCLTCCYNTFAQSHRTEIGFESDDDSYLLQGQDKYYTAGNFVYFNHALNVKDSSGLQNKVLGFQLGQKLFTPQSGSINYTGTDDPRYIDRPFAAYLYVGSTLNLLYKNESNLKLGAQIGIIGPSALGQQTQSAVHQLFGLYHPGGWEYQIDNNFVINFSAEYNKMLARASWIDFSLASYANLGTGFDGAGVGPLVRFGNFNQLFNSVSTQSTAISATRFTPLHDHELFFYYKPQFNVVAYDATVQGSLFGSPDPNSKEITLSPDRFVFSNQLGVSYSGKRIVLDVAVILHSKDVVQSLEADQWATVTLLYRFH